MRQLGGFFPGWNAPARQADEELLTACHPHAAVMQSLYQGLDADCDAVNTGKTMGGEVETEMLLERGCQCVLEPTGCRSFHDSGSVMQTGRLE